MEWTYGAPRAAQSFVIHRFQELQAEPTSLHTSAGADEDFLDLHLGSMLVAEDGAVTFTNPNGVWELRVGEGLELLAGGAEAGFRDGEGAGRSLRGTPRDVRAPERGPSSSPSAPGRVRRVDEEGRVTTVAGAAERGHTDGAIEGARFLQPFAVAVGPGGAVYVLEYEDGQEYRVRVIQGGQVSTLARIACDGVFVK